MSGLSVTPEGYGCPVATPQGSRASADASIAPAVRGQVLGGLEMHPGDAVQSVADRLAALTARAADAPTAMLHLAEGRNMRLVGGCALPEGFIRMEPVPASSTLAGLVVQHGFPVVVEDANGDTRVPVDAPLRAVGIGCYAGFPVRDAGGEVVGVCAVADYRPRRWRSAELSAVDDGAQACTALVGQRQARQQVERQRSFLDTLLDSLDTGVLACDAAGQLLVVNRSLRQRLRIDPAEQPPDTWVPALPLTRPDGRPFTAAEVPLLRALTGQQVHDVEQVATTPEGGRRLYSVNAHPITSPAGQPLGAVSVFHDITERRRAERFRGGELAVTLALNRARSIDEAAPRILQAIAGTVGWPCAELWLVEPGLDGGGLRRITGYQAPGFPANLPAPARLARGQGLAGTAWQRSEPVWHTAITTSDRLAGTETTASCRLRTALALPIDSGGHTLAVMTLFTDQAECPHDTLVALLSGIAAHVGQFIERRRAEDLQHALTASKDEYLNLIGHELRTPLTVIASYIELLDQADPTTTLADAKPLTAGIRRGSDRLRRLVEALLDLSALDSGQATIQRDPVDLTDIVGTAVDQARPAADAKNVAVTTHLPPHLTITGDRQRLTQMVAALLDNAITYTPAGGRTDVRLTHSDDSAQITIADTGVGIPETERPHVFQRFYRGQITTQAAIPGAGLGLPIAQLIAQRHHGDITLIPSTGGTTVRVRLPAPTPPTQADR
jgi:signal transduction histidine kinase/PAS domain-containing protein